MQSRGDLSDTVRAAKRVDALYAHIRSANPYLPKMSIAADQLGLGEYDGALFEGSDCAGDCEGPFIDLSSNLEEAKDNPSVAPIGALSMAPTAGKTNPLLTAPSVSGYHMPEAQSLVPAHVIVLGSGLAGLAAAIEALEAGAFVTLIEKTKQIGGNSAKATSGINGVKTRAQAVKKVNDTIPLFERDTLVSAGPSADPTLVHTLATHSAEALDWLENFGLDLSEVVQIGGHSVPRTHREPVDPTKRSAAAVGWDIIQTLVNHLKKQSPQQLHIILNAYAEKLVTRKMAATGAVGAKTTDSVAVPPAGKVHNYDMLEEVCGVEYRDATGQLQRVTGDAVVLATGGFAADSKSADSLLRKHAPQLLHLATTNGEWAQGEGIKMALRLSDNLRPALVDMEHVQVHPTGFVDPKNPMATPKVLGPESLRGYGGLLLDINGKRFCNELGLRDYVSNEIFKHGFRYTPDGKLAQSAAAAPPSPTAAPVDEKQLPVCAYLIMNDEAVERFGRPAFDFYANKRGLFRSFANSSAMAAALGMEPSVLSDTLAHYVASVHMGKDEFGKRVFPTVIREDAPLHVCLVTPCLHYTMGGLKINSASEVQSERGVHFESSTSLPGLFAAGEVAGGLHGRNRLGGNSLLGCAVFGRIAGRRAAAINQSHLQVLRKDRFTALPLREKWLVGRNTRIYRFQLPSSKQALGYGACQYIAVRAKINGKNEVRFYSPISRYDDMGHLDLLIKADDVARGAGTSMAAVVDNLQPGQTLEFAGPFGDLHLDLALSKPGQWLGNRTGLRPIKKIGMIAGGVGLSPMLQILRSIFHHNREDIQLILLYGAEVEEELVLRDRILAMEKQHPNFKAVFTLHYPPSEEQQKHAGVKYHQGFITGEFIQQHMFAPASDLKIVICGPYKMCQAMKENLENVGYHKSMYYSFM